jgi:hypothetical protein
VIVPVPLERLKATFAEVELSIVAVFMDGVLGVVVIDVDVLDAIDVPPELVAVTEKVYEVFDSNPDTIIGDDVPVPVKPPGLLVTV